MIELVLWTTRITNLAYLIAALLFILALAGLSRQETAQRGNNFGIAGMAIALVATIIKALVQSHTNPEDYRSTLVTAILITLAMGIGAAVGIPRAHKVEMTGMPELIALLHSFVGLAAVLIGFNSWLHPEGLTENMVSFHLAEVFLGIFIGAVTFTGSIVAYLKLSGKAKGAPLMLPGRHMLNAAAIVSIILLMVLFILVAGQGVWAWVSIIAMTMLSLLLGLHLVAAIGGGDMPVVVSMLNS